MLSKILFLIIVLFVLNKKNNIEGIRDSHNCCREGKGIDSNGTIPSNLIDSRCRDSHKYHGVKRCMGPFDSFDCNSTCSLCNYGAVEENNKRDNRNKDPNIKSYGVCIPTLEGGYCRDNNEFKIYDTGEWTDVKKEDRGKDIREDSHSQNVYKERFSQECNPFGNQDKYEEEEEEEEEFADEVAEEKKEGGSGEDLVIEEEGQSDKPDYMKMGLISSLITISVLGLLFLLYKGFKNKNIILFKVKEFIQKIKNLKKPEIKEV